MPLNRIYEIVVLISFLYSMYLWIRKRKSKQQFYIFLYLLLVIGVDIIPVNFPYLLKFDRNILFAGYIVLSILYFGILYLLKVENKIFRIFNIFVITVLVLLNIYKFNNEQVEQLNFIPIISLPVLFIFNSVFWYLYKLKKVDESRITDDFLFWISSGLIIWSVFFIFRAIPMYFLQKNDPRLLDFVISAFTIVNIVTYLLFLLGLILMKDERTS